MMKQSPRQKPIRDERDEQIEVQSKAHSLEYVLSATMILTVICLLKGNPAWKGSISLAFFEAAFEIFYKYKQYEEKLYFIVGVLFLLGGIAFLAWFGFTG